LRDSLPAAFERRWLAQVVRFRKRPYDERGRTRRPSGATPRVCARWGRVARWMCSRVINV